jgi:hypothetical protein
VACGLAQHSRSQADIENQQCLITKSKINKVLGTLRLNKMEQCFKLIIEGFLKEMAF